MTELLNSKNALHVAIDDNTNRKHIKCCKERLTDISQWNEVKIQQNVHETY